MPERILLVEDSRTQAEALRAFLADAGRDVTVAHNAEEALRLLRGGERFDVVLSDVVMPGMSGYELSRTVKAELGGEAPPIVLLTTLADPADIVRGLESGADNYVTKPFEPRQLLDRIAQVVENRRLRGAPRAAAARAPVEVRFMGSTFSISAGREQILDMLLSSFEELIRTAEALRQSKTALQLSHARAEDRAERLARLQQVTEELSRARTSAEVVHVVVTTARQALGADAGLASVLAPDGAALELVEAVGYPEERVRDEWASIPLDSPLPLARAARTGETVVIRDAAERRRFPGFAASTHAAALVAPLVANGEPLGAWALSFVQARRFEEVDLQLFHTLTRQFSQALDRARLFEAEQRARAEAEEANRAKAQFLAAMSHDLRTPLNAIRGYVDLIELGIRGPVTAQQLEDLARIRRSQEFLLSLINDVLNFAKFEAGSVAFQLGPVRVGPLLGDLETMLRPQMEAKSLTYSWSVCDPALAVVADEEKLQQVLLNLGTNALKFTPTGGSVTVTCEVSGERAAIRVADSGIGIPEKDRTSIFDPFVQVHSPLAGAREGIGLGLAISHELVRGMGGDLTVESEVGVGSTFTLLLPLHDPSAPED